MCTIWAPWASALYTYIYSKFNWISKNHCYGYRNGSVHLFVPMSRVNCDLYIQTPWVRFLQVWVVSQCNNWNDIHWPVAACIHFDDIPLFWWKGVAVVQFISKECILWLGRSLVMDGALSIHGRTVIVWGMMVSGAMQYRGTMILVVFMMLIVLMVLVM